MFEAGASCRSGCSATSVSPRSSDTTVTLHSGPVHPVDAMYRPTSARRDASAGAAAGAAAGPRLVGPTAAFEAWFARLVPGFTRAAVAAATVKRRTTTPARIIRWYAPFSIGPVPVSPLKSASRGPTYAPPHTRPPAARFRLRDSPRASTGTLGRRIDQGF